MDDEGWDYLDMETLTQKDLDRMTMEADPRIEDHTPLTVKNYQFPGSKELLFDIYQDVSSGQTTKLNALKTLMSTEARLKRLREAAYGNPRDLPTMMGYLTALAGLAAAYRSVNDPLLKELEKALRFHPNDGQMLSMAVNAHIGLNECQEALELGVKSMESCGCDEHLLFAVSNAFRNLGRDDESLECCLMGLNQHPESYVLACSASVTYKLKGDYENAIRYIRRAIESYREPHTPGLTMEWLKDEEGRLMESDR